MKVFVPALSLVLFVSACQNTTTDNDKQTKPKQRVGLLQSGPMNGYSEMREAAVWVQMSEACEVQMHYWPDTAPEAVMKSAAVHTFAEKAYTAQLTATEVEPGTRYGYAIYADGQLQTDSLDLYFDTQALWQYRSDPPAFRIMAGSCAYINEEAYDRPGRAYGKDYHIYESMADAGTDMMLWLGDNVYFREVDWFSQTGMHKRYTHTRTLPEMQRLLRTGHHYAIWDDHDYGPNDAVRSYPHKEMALETFKQFWANNGYGVHGGGGITSAFQFNDVHFYLLDNRWNRTDYQNKTTEHQMLGEEQMDWLIESLAYSRAPFKIIAVGSQVLNDAKVYENYANYPEERARLLDRIAAEGIKGVIFLTGDRHHTELCKVVHKGCLMYDLTLSPLSSGTHDGGDGDTTTRVDGTLYNETNFGMLDVSGPRKDRSINMRVMDADGNEVWSHVVSEKEWQ